MFENPFEERFLVIAEKPSVAMTIGAVLGCRDKKDGYIEGPDGVVTWCIGHLAEYAMPEAYDEKYRKWSLEALPIIPDKWKLVVAGDKEKQFRLLSGFLNNKFLVPFDFAVNACDAGREGELIFNRVYELSGSRLPVKRLWISSMEDDAILRGFMDMKDAAEYRHLAEASVCRAQADWLVGMNASRAFTKVYDHRFSVGRVQTPTLAMLVKRGEEIDNFQKTQYFVTHLLLNSTGHTIDAVSEQFMDREEANRLAGTCSGRIATVPSIERNTKTVAPPKLYDLTSLQRDANRLFGFSASKTLSCAQNLYENKLITYPRTDSRFLTDDMEKTALDVISACRKAFPFLDPQAASGQAASQGAAAYTQPYDQPDVHRVMDSKKVSDHHAIIPTVMIRNSDFSKCTNEEKNILILIAARLICATGKRHVYESVKASFLCCGYTFKAAGKSIKEEGWKAVDAAMRRYCHTEPSDDQKNDDAGHDGKSESAAMQDLSSLYQGARFMNAETKVTDHWTKPLPQYNEDTLLHAMETAGANQLEASVERKGLGTPATRAAIIDKLVSSNYVVRNKRQLIATEAGKQLITVLPEYLKSAQMTADWENQLLQIEHGQYDSSAFMDGIRQMLLRMIKDCKNTDESERKRFGGHSMDKEAGERESLGACPVCGKPVYEANKVFHCSDRECGFILWKKNRYLDRMRTSLDREMVKDLLEKGKTHVRGLYSPGKDKYFSADLLMKWKDGRASFSLEFPHGKANGKEA